LTILPNNLFLKRKKCAAGTAYEGHLIWEALAESFLGQQYLEDNFTRNGKFDYQAWLSQLSFAKYTLQRMMTDLSKYAGDHILDITDDFLLDMLPKAPVVADKVPAPNPILFDIRLGDLVTMQWVMIGLYELLQKESRCSDSGDALTLPQPTWLAIARHQRTVPPAKHLLTAEMFHTKPYQEGSRNFSSRQWVEVLSAHDPTYGVISLYSDLCIYRSAAEADAVLGGLMKVKKTLSHAHTYYPGYVGDYGGA
jgi:hypothetical protein